MNEPLVSQLGRVRGASRAEAVYARLREDIFEFRLLPGDRFTESEVAERLGVSRTPVREALLRLQSEGMVQVYFRNGWEVVPLDFRRFADLYEFRRLIEHNSVRALCAAGPSRADRSVLDRLGEIWEAATGVREQDGRRVAALDEAFHLELARAAGNQEMALALEQITNRVRLIRRLDFQFSERVALTYAEHARLLQVLRARRVEQALALMAEHIDDSHDEVSKITIQRLQEARAAHPGQALGRPGRL